MEVDARTRLAGRYELGAEIGHGGTAQVFRAYDHRLERSVAVKCFDAAALRIPDARERFEDEARIAASVSHPNVVRVLDLGVDASMPFIVMECLPGNSLLDEIRRGPLAPQRVVRIVCDILAGLRAVHECGVVHRDLKPGNVLFDPDGRAKLGDFGIARIYDGTSTRSKTVLGTPEYLAPERVLGRCATVHTDLYSVGVIAYEALSGVRPFEGHTAVAIAEAVHRGEHTPLREAAPGVPPALADVVTRAMSRSPIDRYASAADFAAALEGCAYAPASPAPPRRLRRLRARGLSIGFGVLALFGLFAGAVFERDDATPPHAQPAANKTNMLPAPLVHPFDELQRSVHG